MPDVPAKSVICFAPPMQCQMMNDMTTIEQGSPCKLIWEIETVRAYCTLKSYKETSPPQLIEYCGL